MSDIKAFQNAVWQLRKQHGRQYLKKSQLAEAYKLYKQADENIEKFHDLLRGMRIRGIVEKHSQKRKFVGRYELKTKTPNPM